MLFAQLGLRLLLFGGVRATNCALVLAFVARGLGKRRLLGF